MEILNFLEKVHSFASHTPDEVMFVDNNGTRQTTYAEFWALTQKIASLVCQRLQGKEKLFVPIYLTDSMEYFASELAIWMTGNAAVHMGLSFPIERVDYIMQHCEAEFKIDETFIQESRQHEGKHTNIRPRTPDQPCAMFYTSGSTGTPKGVMHSDAGFMRAVTSFDKAFSLKDYASYATTTSCYFVLMIPAYSMMLAHMELHLLAPETRRDVHLLEDYIAAHQIEFAAISPSLLRIYKNKAKSLKVVQAAGERIVGCYSEEYTVLNTYGQTETAGLAFLKPLDKDYDNTPIGRPVPGVEYILLDEDGHEVPDGQVGELCYTSGMNRPIYYKEPERTAALTAGGVMHTGDLVMRLPDGDILYVQRKDWMVKINGQRVEPGEVEAAMRKVDGIDNAVVKGFVNDAGSQYLVGYYTLAQAEKKLEEAFLREKLSEYLPAYMIPLFLVRMDSFPLNANGKIDRKVLQAPDLKSMAREYVAPTNETERILCDAFANVLGMERIGINDDFFILGGDSIRVMKLQMMCPKLALSSRLIHAQRTPKNIAETLSATTATTSHGATEAKLTQTQLGIYFECMKREGEATYNNPFLYRFSKKLDPDRLVKAIEQTVRAHPALNATIFTGDEGSPMMKVVQWDEPTCTVEQMSEVELTSLLPQLEQPFNLHKDRLYRIRIIETEKAQYIFTDIHHVIFDGTSMHIFLADIDKAYKGEIVEAEEYSAYDVAVDEQQERSGANYQQAKAWYNETFDSSLETTKPSPDKDEPTMAFGHDVFTLGMGAEELQNWCNNHGITANVLTTAAFGKVLATYTMSEKAVFATIYNGRNNINTAHTMAMLVKTLPVCISIEKGLLVADLLERTKQQMMGAMANDIYSFAELSSGTGITSDVMFAYQAEMHQLGSIDNASLEPVPINFNATGVPFNCQLMITAEGRLELDVQYHSNAYSMDFVRRFASVYGTVLHEMTIKDKVSDIQYLNKELREEVDAIRQTCLDPHAVRFPLFHNSIEYWAEQTPDKTAIIACNETLTYRQFNEKANNLAHALINKGVLPGDRICLLLPRKSWHLIAMFGVMKAGAAYIPCDPEYPAERIRLITEDSHARYVITTADKMADYGERALNIEEILAEDMPKTNPAIAQSSDSLAYLIYTSGSTGRPKGVMLRHIGICNYLTDHEENRHFHALVHDCKTMLCITTVSFDLSLKEIGASLFNGMTLVFADEEQVNDPQALADLMLATGVDGFSGTPSRLKMFLDLPDFQKAFSQCKFIVLGGEKYPPTLLPQVKALAPTARLFNTYGPTEISVSCNGKELTHAGNITIGRPLLNVKEYVVDNDLNELPVGVTGELLIGGLGVAAGYNDLPDKTAEAFIDYSGERCYKSGDYAYWNAEGEVIILGRKDHQIKLNGLRIELGEVETVLNKQPQIKEGVVMIKTVNGHDHLVAYYVVREQVSTDTLKEQMGKSLTHYMVPTIFMELDRMPISPNGKTDLKSLPEPVMAEREYIAPEGDIEKFFCECFATILEQEQVGATDNFFEIGGTSLIAMRVVMAAANAGYRIVYKQVFDNPTPRMLAQTLNPDNVMPTVADPVSKAEDEEKTPAGQTQWDGSDPEVQNYDYTAINALLAKNTLAYFKSDKPRRSLGTCIVTGATGYLGIHIVKELIDNPDVPAIYCVVRSNKEFSAQNRLRTQLFYYFDDTFDSLFGKRIFVIDNDVTKSDCFASLEETFRALKGQATLFNCAANVKHFSAGTDIEDINIGGCQTCIDFCVRTGTRFIQTSTHSIAGTKESDGPCQPDMINETKLYWGQKLDNQYCHAKFIAERNVLEAIVEKGLDAKIVRLGNLSARSTDGEFQINFRTNSFMGRLKAYQVIGCIPYQMAQPSIEFSPINEVAKAVVLLATTSEDCTVFHPVNSHRQLFDNVIVCLNNLGVNIQYVENDDYQRALDKAFGVPSNAPLLQSLMAYQSAPGKYVVTNGDNYDYTTQVLLRLGFRWNFTSWDYMERFITAIQGLGFFDEDYHR